MEVGGIHLGKITWLLSAGMLVSLVSNSTLASEKLIVVGGGARPARAMAKFAHWGGGEKARILVISWASPDPQDYFDYFAKDIWAYNPVSVSHAVLAANVSTDRDKLVNQIADATAIFFTGGDQNKTMDLLDADAQAFAGKATLVSILRDRYHDGVAFGGTSAGTAIMSTPMLTGSADLLILDGKQVETRDGLGLLPGTILDQHFMAKGRVLRLMGLVQQHPKKLGLGIDEDTALAIEDGRYAEVIGASHVLAMWASGAHGEVTVDPLKPGTKYDLVKRARY
jgi:cyanophycinase